MAEARKAGAPVDAVVTCGNLPELRSLTMPLIEELDVEVETLDSLEGLVVKPAVVEKLGESARGDPHRVRRGDRRAAPGRGIRRGSGGRRRRDALRAGSGLRGRRALGLGYWYSDDADAARAGVRRRWRSHRRRPSTKRRACGERTCARGERASEEIPESNPKRPESNRPR